MLGDIGTWVLRQACIDVVSWPGELKVAVNLSPLQFRDKDLAQHVAHILAETGMDPKRLELEVTESILIGEMITGDDCAAIIRAIVDLGRSLGMAVNAEGVETEKQFASLCSEGCGEVQGYLFSKPKPASEILTLLIAHQSRKDGLGHAGAALTQQPEELRQVA